MKKLLLLFLSFVFYITVYSQNNYFYDSRDCKQYKTVTIENTVWMVQNLNYLTETSWVYYDNKKTAKKFGRLYTWEEAKNICPPGWKLPTSDDWENVFFKHPDSLYLLKIKYGGLMTSDGVFANMESGATYWTSTEFSRDSSYIFFIDREDDIPRPDIMENKCGLSVRCIKE